MESRCCPDWNGGSRPKSRAASHFDRFTRGRYATDASHYQIVPLGVVTPRTIEEAERAIAICRAEGVPVTRARRRLVAGRADRQPLGHRRLLEASRHASSISTSPARRCAVEPGIVLDDLNRQLKPHGLWFPVDVSTASRATIGGMTAQQLLRRALAALRQHARERASSIDALLADGGKAHFGPVAADLSDVPDDSPLQPLARDLFALGAREADEIAARFPKVQRRVGGYNLDALVPGRNDINLAHILVGSEGTLGVLDRDRAEAVAAARPRARSAPAISAASTRRWRRRSTSSSSRRSRSSWSTRP